MRKKYLVIILLLAAYVAMTAGCTSKHLTKSDGSSQGQNISSEKQQNVNEKNALSDQNQKSVRSVNSKDNNLKASSEENTDFQDIHFAFASHVIQSQYRDILKSNADFLRANKKFKVTIEGHCDERGTSEYNMALGQARADEVKKYMINLGVSDKRITTVSYGKEKPLDPGHDEEAWAKNRRAHFVMN